MSEKKPISPTVVKKIIKMVGAERVENDAVDLLTQIINEKAEKIAKGAVKLAKHAGRNTVEKSDVKLVIIRK